MQAEAVSQSNSQPLSQPVSQLVSQPASQSVSQSASQPASQSVSQSVSQPASQSVSQSVRQAVSQSMLLTHRSRACLLLMSAIFSTSSCTTAKSPRWVGGGKGVASVAPSPRPAPSRGRDSAPTPHSHNHQPPMAHLAPCPKFVTPPVVSPAVCSLSCSRSLCYNGQRIHSACAVTDNVFTLPVL